MKKVYIALCLLAVSATSFAQTVANAGFEAWRTGTSGSSPSPVVPIAAPTDWYGYDSLIVAGEEAYLPLFLSGYTPTDLHQQVFKESSIVHGGTYAAKMVSLKQDTLGGFIGGSSFIAGSISNAQPALNLSALTTGDYLHAIVYSTPGDTTSLRITTVSAWIEYIPGKDSATGALGTGTDTGSFVVEAISQVAGSDSVVGSAIVNIPKTTSYTQFTAMLTYVDTVDLVSSVRITFASGQLFNTVDSSIMYVDDVSMTGIPQTAAVHNVTGAVQQAKIYPNPVSGMLYIDGASVSGAAFRLLSVSGQVVATKTLTGTDMLDVSALPDGMYFYSITSKKGNNIQTGNMTVCH